MPKKLKLKTKPRTKPRTIRFPVEILAWFKRASRMAKVSENRFVNNLVRQHFERRHYKRAV